MSRRSPDVTADLILRAYSIGLFPMAESRENPQLHWLDPEMRGHLPLDGFHLSRRLFRTVVSGPYQVTADQDFRAAIAACAQPAPGRTETWINPAIEELFCEIHEMGHGHSVETWLDGELVGGLYGVALGGAFFGESMFSRARDASKVALAHLVARLRLGGFSLLDTQWTTSHLAQFGGVEIPRREYRRRLEIAISQRAVFDPTPEPEALRAEFIRMARGE
jgi:leucyl/phenylalanyl-tRNA---protein transferase